MYPVAQMVAPNGTVLEGRGVAPDIEANLDREALEAIIETGRSSNTMAEVFNKDR